MSKSNTRVALKSRQLVDTFDQSKYDEYRGQRLLFHIRSSPVRDILMTRWNHIPTRFIAALIAICGSVVAVGAEPKKADRPPSDDPKIQAAIDRGLVALRRIAEGRGVESKSLVALALLKSGDEVESPVVQQGITGIQSRIKEGEYRPDRHHYYSSGLDMMLLETADPAQYQSEMRAILRYILDGQLANGSWFYPNQDGKGDTSITQYAMLGLWSAARADIEISMDVWDRAATWHVKTQLKSGGFTYHPGSGAEGAKSTMTAAAVGSLNIARMHLYPNRKVGSAKKKKKKKSTPRKFRYLQPIDLDNPNSKSKQNTKKVRTTGNPTTSLSAIDDATERGVAWLATNWTVNNGGAYTHYYLYAIERMTALADIDFIGEHDWYAEASEYLLKTQKSDGSFGGDTDTSFSLLCLGKATAKMLDRKVPSIGVGAGLLAGGRGLPDNLAQVQVTEGKVKARKIKGPLDELLNELENPKSTKVESVQSAVLERIQLGNREELIGQTDRLARLAKDPRADVRRIALWALGRSGDVRFAPVLIASFADSDLDVLIEARNALCTLSRKPRGFVSLNHPYAKLSEKEKIDETQRSQALGKWRTELTAKWKQWHLSVRPYDERDGLPESGRK
mgnify:CR=1 FL=1